MKSGELLKEICKILNDNGLQCESSYVSNDEALCDEIKKLKKCKLTPDENKILDRFKEYCSGTS